MNGKEDVKGTQGTEKAREVEEKIKASEQPEPDAADPKRRHLLRRFWKSAAGFWGKREERLSWVLSGAVLLIILLNVSTSYGMNLWNREIFDALERRDSQTVLFLSTLYFPLLLASVF
jgi:putative ATP-binding cassette transporter